MTDLILIRHGETDWNVAGRYQGQADPTLNNRGLEQAHQLARELRSSPLDVIYTSPLLRAVQTAKIIMEVLDLHLREDSRLMEIHQGKRACARKSKAYTPSCFAAGKPNHGR